MKMQLPVWNGGLNTLKMDISTLHTVAPQHRKTFMHPPQGRLPTIGSICQIDTKNLFPFATITLDEWEAEELIIWMRKDEERSL